MHSDVTQALQRLRIGEPAALKNLTMHPLLDGSSGSPDYLLLEQAVQDGPVQVTEVSEAGSVNSLKVTNRRVPRFAPEHGRRIWGHERLSR